MEDKESKPIRAEKAAIAKARKVNRGARSQLEGFMDFIRRHGVVGLAIGLVLGIQVKTVVDQTVASFINPILGLILPGTGSLAEKTFKIHVGHKPAVFAYGAFISVLISFITVAFLVYFAVNALKLDRLDKKQ